ncbi:MAG: TonB-dependent receptor [Acidobacteria bacterium]|nr:TonB-dependent receptor [Acidobacteriota bacterium]MDA1235117.1 TonB-dependent receptor [Acidobacteriota bacterium]
MLLPLLAVFAIAQDTGRISGVVQDASGAVIPGVTVTALEAQTGLSRTAETNETGAYSFPALRPTEYSVRAETTGFQTSNQTGVVLDASANMTLNFTLQIGELTEVIEVESQAVAVNTTSSELSEVVDRARIIELPLNGRDVAKLANTVTGVIMSNISGESAKAIPGALEISANGTPGGRQTAYKLDGANNTDFYFQRNMSFPNPDAVQEFSIQTSNYSATTGNNAGASVNVVTRSGTNEWHGGVFEFVRNRVFNARNTFAADRDQLKRNEFGGHLGGPIIRNKSFFFASWQQRQLRDVRSAITAFAPTTAMQAGDFGSCGVNCDRETPVDPLTGVPFANKQIPISRFDPAAVKVASLMPTLGGDGFTVIPRPSKQDTNQFVTRIDHMLTDNDRLTGRYFVDHFDNAGNFDSSNILTYRGPVIAARVRVQNLMVGWQKTFSPTVLNDVKFSYQRMHAARGPYFDGVPSMSSLGVRLPLEATLPSISQIEVAGFWRLGDNLEAIFARNGYQLADAASVIKGNHTIQFGGEISHQRVDITNEYRRNGHFIFRGNASGSAQADFFLGAIDSFDHGTGEYKNFRANYLALYIQDDWKVNSRLTLNLGMRYEPTPAWHDTVGRFQQFKISDYENGVQSGRFENAPPGLLYRGDPGVPKDGADPDRDNFGGRFGFAYALTSDGKTSIRGGAGMFYDQHLQGDFNNGGVNGAPWSLRLSVTRPEGPFSDPYRGRDDFDGITVDQIGAADAVFPTPVLATTYDGRQDTPLQYNWNMTLEREVMPQWVARAAYVGSASNFGRQDYQLNAAQPFVGATTRSTDARRPFAPLLGRVTQFTEDRHSSYHSMQLTLIKRFSKGVTFRGAYTWSKALGNYAAEVVPWFLPGAESYRRGPLDIDHRHRAVMSWVWELPTVDSENAFIKHVVNGWQWTGLADFQTGQPLTFTSGRDNSLTGIGRDRALLTGAPLEAPSGADKRVGFNSAAFARNDLNTFGDAGVGIMTGPSQYSWNMGLFKNFQVTERLNVQLRSEYFNIFNQTNFANPNTNASSGGFGNITRTHPFAGDPRIIQFGLKVRF